MQDFQKQPRHPDHRLDDRFNIGRYDFSTRHVLEGIKQLYEPDEIHVRKGGGIEKPCQPGIEYELQIGPMRLIKEVYLSKGLFFHIDDPVLLEYFGLEKDAKADNKIEKLNENCLPWEIQSDRQGKVFDFRWEVKIEWTVKWPYFRLLALCLAVKQNLEFFLIHQLKKFPKGGFEWDKDQVIEVYDEYYFLERLHSEVTRIEKRLSKGIYDKVVKWIDKQKENVSKSELRKAFENGEILGWDEAKKMLGENEKEEEGIKDFSNRELALFYHFRGDPITSKSKAQEVLNKIKKSGNSPNSLRNEGKDMEDEMKSAKDGIKGDSPKRNNRIRECLENIMPYLDGNSKEEAELIKLLYDDS